MHLSTFFGSSKKSSGLFIPCNTEFIELTDKIPFKSINGISEHLGYHPDQVHAYYEGQESKSDIINVIVEIFSNNVIFVLTKDTVNKLSKKSVENYLRNFSVKKVFNSYTTENILETAVENKSLKMDFLARILKIEDPEEDGMYYVESLEYYLYFVDGYLVSFQSSDGLNESAKNWKQNSPTYFRGFEKVSRLYWGNDITSVINEINTQADAWSKIPFVGSNEFLDLHETEYGTTNYVMLLVCHYNYGISLKDFITVNHGRFIKVAPNKYRVNKFSYEFDESESLIKFYLAN